jgi:predicted type IV restriction endonuclease
MSETTEPTETIPISTGDDAPKVRTQPKWLTDATTSIKTLRKFATHAQRMVERDANETDTRLLVTDILTEVLGWDKYSDVSTEYQVRGEYADYALRADGQLFAMVEVKRAAQKLSERHLRQIESYGLREGADWLILTNGQVWKIYRLVPQSAGTKPEHMFSIDLSELSKIDFDNMLALHKQAVKRGHIETMWTRYSALAPQNLDAVLLSERVVNAVRLEVRASCGYNADTAEVTNALKNRLT